MGLLGSLVGAPGRSLMFVFRSIHDAVEGELEARQEAIRVELNELYLALEAGEIEEDEFDDIEDELIDQLEQIEQLLAEQRGEG